jgi:WD40 repeat protein
MEHSKSGMHKLGLMLVLKGHLHDVFLAASSTDGSQVVFASKDGTVCIWDTTTGNTKQLLK